MWHQRSGSGHVIKAKGGSATQRTSESIAFPFVNNEQASTKCFSDYAPKTRCKVAKRNFLFPFSRKKRAPLSAQSKGYHKGNGLERCLTRFNAARCGVNNCLLWGTCAQQPRLPILVRSPMPRRLAVAIGQGAAHAAPRVGPAPWSRWTSCPAQLRLRRVASRCRRPAADDLGCQLARCASHEARPAAPSSQAVDTLLFNHDG